MYPNFLIMGPQGVFWRTIIQIINLKPTSGVLAHKVLLPVHKIMCNKTAGWIMLFYGDFKFTLLDITFLTKLSSTWFNSWFIKGS